MRRRHRHHRGGRRGCSPSTQQTERDITAQAASSSSSGASEGDRSRSSFRERHIWEWSLSSTVAIRQQSLVPHEELLERACWYSRLTLHAPCQPTHLLSLASVLASASHKWYRLRDFSWSSLLSADQRAGAFGPVSRAALLCRSLSFDRSLLSSLRVCCYSLLPLRASHLAPQSPHHHLNLNLWSASRCVPPPQALARTYATAFLVASLARAPSVALGSGILVPPEFSLPFSATHSTLLRRTRVSPSASARARWSSHAHLLARSPALTRARASRRRLLSFASSPPWFLRRRVRCSRTSR